MADINDLNLVEPEESAEPIDEKATAGAARGTFYPVPSVGPHRFRLPENLEGIYGTVDTQRGQRIKATFDEEKALLVDGRPFKTTITSVELNRAKKGAPPKYISDFTALFAALGEPLPKTHAHSREFIAGLSRHGGAEFIADVEWEAYCNDQRDIYAYDEAGIGSKREGTKGCGQEYQVNSFPRKDGSQVLAIPSDNGKLLSRFQCACGAALNVRATLDNFRKAR